tara:strand:+ start:524 stop:775 length:252 start_codon:yes stop_codon:yes gene_type:complete
MIVELIFLVEVLQKRGLHQTSGKPSFWRSRTQTPSVVTPTPIVLGKAKTVTESFQELPVLTEETFTPRPPSKFTGDIQLKKFF